MSVDARDVAAYSCDLPVNVQPLAPRGAEQALQASAVQDMSVLHVCAPELFSPVSMHYIAYCVNAIKLASWDIAPHAD